VSSGPVQKEEVTFHISTNMREIGGSAPRFVRGGLMPRWQSSLSETPVINRHAVSSFPPQGGGTCCCGTYPYLEDPF
jgi:hypothetical protein